MKQYFIAAMFNVFLPSVLGGDAVRLFLLKGEGLAKRNGGMFIFIERLIGLFCLLFIAFVSSFFISIPSFIQLGIVAGISAYAILLFLIFFSKTQPNFIKKAKLEDTIATFNKLKQKKLSLLFIFGLSVIIQFLAVYISYTVSQAFGIQIGLLPFLVFVPLIWLFTILPISLGGIGLREMAFLYFFSYVGLASENALIISLGTYLTFLTSGIIGAGIFFYEKIFLQVKYSFLKEKK